MAGRKKRFKRIVILFWVLLLGGYWLITQLRGISTLAAAQQLIEWAETPPFGPLIYLLAYLLRPILLFPSVLLTASAGYLYGPLWGTILALIGSNASASFAYVIGRYFGQDLLSSEAAQTLISRYTKRLRRNSFESTLIMRFLFMPYDLVSYVAGFLNISWRAFALATLIGGVLGSLSFVFFGASLEGEFVMGEQPTLEPLTLLAGATMFLLSLALSRLMRRREERQAAASSN